jgi:pimeloyl-ACP methyl ester carboxylesterase
MGHHIESWGNFPGLLESDSDFRNVEFFFWGFPTGVIAAALETELRNRFANYELVLIGHSFGGIIIKKMLLECGEDILTRVKHVILFATPHLGASLAAFGAPFNSQIKELQLNGDFLTQLERAWVKSRVKGGAQMLSLTNVTGLEDSLVSQWSATTVSEDCEVVSGSHASIVKPESRNDTSYILVKRRLQGLWSVEAEAGPSPVQVKGGKL